MSTLVTGTNGRLGEALVRTLRDQGHDPIDLDIFRRFVPSLACPTRSRVVLGRLYRPITQSCC